MNAKLLIRPPRADDDFLKIQDLQKSIWGMSERETVDTYSMREFHRNGGLVLGAFDQQTGEMLAFILDFLGLNEKGRPGQYSFMLGVIADHRNKGIGFRLKQEEYSFCRSNGIDLVRWNLDPLNGPYAALSFRKLGALANRYDQDQQGSSGDTTKSTTNIEGLIVEWWINSVRVNRRLEHGALSLNLKQVLAEGGALVNQTQMDNGLLKLTNFNLNLDKPTLSIEIPGNFEQLESGTPDWASEWRTGMRDILGSYLAKGYVLADFFSEDQEEHRRNFYVMRYSHDTPLERLPSVT